MARLVLERRREVSEFMQIQDPLREVEVTINLLDFHTTHVKYRRIAHYS